MTTLEIILSVIIAALLYAVHRLDSDRRLVEYMLATTVQTADQLFERINQVIEDVVVDDEDERAMTEYHLSWESVPYFMLPNDLSTLGPAKDTDNVATKRNSKIHRNFAEQFTEEVLSMAEQLRLRGLRVSLDRENTIDEYFSRQR